MIGKGKTILIMAGGTGGHIMPGLAVARTLRREGWRVVWLGNPEGMEGKLVPAAGIELAPLRFAAVRGKGLKRFLTLPLALLSGFAQAWRALSHYRPCVALGFGGYVSFPGAMMAVLRRIPLVIHEQNAIAGLANRVLAPIADRILTGFPNVLKKGVWVGNPVRSEIVRLSEPQSRYAEHERESGARLRLLVLGGSLGAQAINEALPAALARIEEARRPEIVHQTGAAHLEATREAYRAAGVSAHVVAFIEDMAGAYAWADVVLARAGASTIAELAAAGIASILVPYPHAVDDHQTANARFLSQAGAAILLPQSELTPDRLVLLSSLSRPQLLEMARQARLLAKPYAAEEVALACRELSP